ncbi:MAG: hypothetical protein ACO1N0_17730 [Fluviicola sp.]
MKQLLLISFLLIIRNVSAQDTLYHRIPGLGSQKYVLNEDRTFIYTSFQCGFGFVSYGSYRKNILGYRFSYDTTKCPQPSIVSLNEEFESDYLTLFFYDMVDRECRNYYDSVVIGDQSFECQSDSIAIPKKSIKTNAITLRGEFSNELTFTFDPACNQLNIYLNLSIYDCGVNDIRTLKKTKHGYLHKAIHYDENREKPWKKGKKRVVREYYQGPKNSSINH